MYLLGFDIGSSSIKATLVDASDGRVVKTTQLPEKEMEIMSPQAGWAEQHPELWWEYVCKATQSLLAQGGVNPQDIGGIGIAYQMHGLVLVDKNLDVLRPSIIWCDSRAVQIGNEAFHSIGEEKSLRHLLNSPGNFTASKLKWVMEHEPKVYEKAYKMLLPGDFIALKMTGEAVSTISGLSEGILWDFQENSPADLVLENFGLRKDLIPDLVPTFGEQGSLTASAATAMGLRPGIPVTYRAGDQPNNALSLNVFEPGEVAATGGTSGVVYGIVDEPSYDSHSRVNSFAHVNYTQENPRIGVLLCINGAGIQYSWLKQQIAQEGTTYNDMEEMIASIPVNSDGLCIIPFGNGAERILGNRNMGSHILNLQFNRHTRAHFYRAALEGIAFSFVYGVRILEEMGINASVMRVGNDNLFRSQVFSSTISNLLGNRIEVMKTTGATGAAKAAGIGAGAYNSTAEALGDPELVAVFEPNHPNGLYEQAYQHWQHSLNKILRG